MKVKAGIWIDHQRTLIVITFDGGEKKLEIRADPSGPRTLYYTKVIRAVWDAEAILVFGPGEAKNELRQHLVRAMLGGKVVGVEAVEAMTDLQIAAKVREHFQPAKPARAAAGGHPSFTNTKQEQRP